MRRSNLIGATMLMVVVASVLVSSCSDDPAETKRFIDTYFATLTESEYEKVQRETMPLPPGGQVLLVPIRTDETTPPEMVPLLLWPGEPEVVPTKTYNIKRFLEFDAQGKAQCPNEGTTCGLTITIGDDEEMWGSLATREIPDSFFATLRPSEVEAIDRGTMSLPEGGVVLNLTRRIDGTSAPTTIPLAIWPAEPVPAGDKTYEIKRTLELDNQGNAQCPNDGTTCGLVIVIGDGGGEDP